MLCLSGELFDDFHAVHFARQLRQDRCLIAKPGADLQHDIVGPDFEQIGHQCDNEGLGDRLFETDGKWNIGVGVGLKLDRHELMPRYVAHCSHDAFVESRLAENVAHVKYAGGNFHQHMLAKDLEVFRAHCAILRLAGDRSSRQGAMMRCAPCSPQKM